MEAGEVLGGMGVAAVMGEKVVEQVEGSVGLVLEGVEMGMQSQHHYPAAVPRCLRRFVRSPEVLHRRWEDQRCPCRLAMKGEVLFNNSTPYSNCSAFEACARVTRSLR